MSPICRFRMGEATCTVLDSGLLTFDMAAGFGLPEAAWRERYTHYFDHILHLPMQHLLVQMPETTLLVDAGSYEIAPDSPMRVPNYTPPPSIPTQLRELGVDPAAVQHILITHLHLDHYNGLTEGHSDPVAAQRDLDLCFPKATVYVGAGDWARTEMQTAVQTPGSEEYATLGRAARAGQLRTVDAPLTVAPGLTLYPLPGETPGHLGLRLESGGQVLAAIGDLYHHVVEVGQPEWHVTWADHASLVDSRARFVADVRRSQPWIMASHIPGVGRLVLDGDAPRWEEIAL
jgi:glyoxylase-like metal-dependent hydrolase (beta-lactamase superfamily II)